MERVPAMGYQYDSNEDAQAQSTPVGCTGLLQAVSSGCVEKRDAIYQVPINNCMDISSLSGGAGLPTLDPCSAVWSDITQCTDGPRNLLQLMVQASNGELGPMVTGDYSMEYPSIPEYPPEEEYYGGVESEEDAESSDDDGYEDDAVLPVDNFIDKDKSTNEHISQFDDRISNEDFNSRRDCIYDSWELGIDDTDMNETEVEVDIGQDLHLLSSLGEVGGSSDQDQSCCYGANGLETPDLLGGCGCQHVDLTQEISQKHLEEIKLGFKKRNKILKGAVVVDCRNPRDMGAIEIALRTRYHRVTECIFEPILGMVFDSKEEAYDFYNMYSWELGFGIIYNTRKCSGSENNKYISMQEITCKKGGHDPRIIESTKKDKCPARMRLLRNDDGGWYVSIFVKEHNHEMAETYAEKREWGSHKRMDPYSLNVIRYLRKNNIPLTKVHCIIGSMFGSLKDAPCTKRSLRTICSQIAREHLVDDIAKTLEIFKEMKANDPGFQWSVERGENNTIKTLMWANGKSRELYACFGDVVTFDTTYCTIIYKMPFGLFVGVKNHFQSIIYAGVLMKEEKTESFMWVFNEFLKLMGGKAPETVLTDQCKSMTIALGEVWPDTFHLWCKWHVFKRIREGLGPTYTKNATFRAEFYTIANEMLTKEEFVMAWIDLCKRYGLLKNEFMIRTFQCRMKWARAWAKGHYCAGMTSTQRSESANMMLKRFVPRNSSLNQFVSQYNVLLQDRDMEEGRQIDLTKQLVLKKTRMWPIERHACEIYTKASFMLFRKQVDRAASYVVSGKGDDFYVVSHSSSRERPKWAKVDFKVFVLNDGGRYYCECGFYEHIGILCCHAIRLMIRLGISKIPEEHIMTRWTRRAKDVLPEHLKGHQIEVSLNKPLVVHSMQLNAKALEAVSKGNTDIETLQVVMKHLNAAIKEVDGIIRARRAKNVSPEVQDKDNLCVDSEDALGTQTDVESMRGNRYGASGSSARMSDSEILKLKAPIANRARGRMRANRYRSQADIASQKLRTKKINNGESTEKRKAGEDLGQSRAAKPKAKRQRKTNEDKMNSEENRGLPYQTRFCSKCKLGGHNKTTCGRQSKTAKKKETELRCTKCDLKGHIAADCLVVEDDSDSFFK